MKKRGSNDCASLVSGAVGNAGEKKQRLRLSHGVASVGVPSIDREHEECVLALNVLVQKQSLSALKQVVVGCSVCCRVGARGVGGVFVLSKHPSAFNMHVIPCVRPSGYLLMLLYSQVHTVLASHFLREEDLLVKHKWGGDSSSPFSPMKSHLEDHRRILRLIEETTEVDAHVAALLVQEFENHAERFDNHYATHLQSAGCE